MSARTRADLHDAVDSLLGQYLGENADKLPSNTRVLEMLDWHLEKMAAEPSRVWGEPSPAPAPVPMILHCPACHMRHVDEGEFAEKPHHTHACQNAGCGHVWRPAVVPTVGVLTLPGLLNAGAPPEIAKNAVLLCTRLGWTVHRIRQSEWLADGSRVLFVSPKVGGGPHRDPEDAVAVYLGEAAREAARLAEGKDGGT